MCITHIVLYLDIDHDLISTHSAPTEELFRHQATGIKSQGQGLSDHNSRTTPMGHNNENREGSGLLGDRSSTIAPASYTPTLKFLH